MKSRMAITVLLFAVFQSVTIVFPNPLQAHTQQDEALPNIGVDEKPGAELPLDLMFIDQDGKLVRLGDYFTGGPVILTLNYYSCPTLCPLVFRNLAKTISGLKGLSPAKDYRIVTVSIDPDETEERAYAKAEESWRMLPGLAEPARRWPFLFANGAAGERLAQAVGVRYTQLSKNNFAHPSVMLVVTPSGKVARYLYGIELRPADLKLALMEAAGGKIGGSPFLNRVILYCYHYDPVGKKYGLAAVNIMKISGVGVLLFLGVMLFLLRRSDKRRNGGDGNGSEDVNR